MSDSARHALFAIPEVTYGLTPATPAFATVRHTGVTLGLSKSTLISAELRSDRQIADFRHGTKQIGGDIQTEVSYGGNFDTLLEAVLLGTWAVKAAPFVSSATAAVAADNSLINGVQQVETATAAGSVSGDGNASVTITGVDVVGSPLVLAVAVLNGDTASDWATKVRAALNATAAITNFFTVGGSTTAISLTRKVPAANDATLNIALATGTATGITAAPTSANTTAGVVGTFPSWVAGDKITIAGFTGTVANNQNATIVSRTASKIVVTTAVALVDDAAGESVTLTSLTYALKAGTTRRSFSLLRNFSDLATGGFHLFSGVEFNKLALKLSVNQIVTAVFSALGQAMAEAADTAPSGSTYNAPTTTSPLDSFSGSLVENGTTLALLTELALTLENGLEARFVVGSDETIRPSIGRSNLSAQATAYFESSTLLNKFINETESSMVVNLPDLAGNAYRLTLPRIKYNGGQPDTQGQGAITLAMPIQALYDSVTGTNIIIERIPA